MGEWGLDLGRDLTISGEWTKTGLFGFVIAAFAVTVAVAVADVLEGRVVEVGVVFIFGEDRLTEAFALAGTGTGAIEGGGGGGGGALRVRTGETVAGKGGKGGSGLESNMNTLKSVSFICLFDCSFGEWGLLWS